MTNDERARGMGTGEDEPVYDSLELSQRLKSENCPGVSFPVIHMIVRASRKGMVSEKVYLAAVKGRQDFRDALTECRKNSVPASEVERIRIQSFEAIASARNAIIAEEVKRERERCAAIALKYKEVMGPDIAREILTPSGEGENNG